MDRQVRIGFSLIETRWGKGARAGEVGSMYERADGPVSFLASSTQRGSIGEGERERE